jgi:hypothetical protein
MRLKTIAACLTVLVCTCASRSCIPARAATAAGATAAVAAAR